MPTIEIRIRATQHASAHEAIQHLDVSSHDRAILVGGMYLTAREAEIEKIERAGIEFAYLVHHQATGRIMTVPINDR